MGPPIITSPIEWSILAQFALAFFTLVAVVVALCKEDIVTLWRRPKLAVTINLAPPDCHKTYWKDPEKEHCYYFRLWVWNKGNIRAEKVQVFADKLSKKIVDGSFVPVEDFIPMNLRWAYSHEIFADGISPLMGKHCDLGHITSPNALISLQEDHPNATPGSTILALDLEVKPNTKNHLVLPGTYRLTLKIAAANFKPMTKKLEIIITGEWYDDQKEMFSNGIRVKMLK